MRYTISTLLITLCLAWSGGCARQPNANELFNGKDLTGWRSYQADHVAGTEDVWSVRDGMIICTGQPMGYLYTRQAFTNFRLTVEYRWPAGKTPGNSGVFLRINGKPQPLPRCFECQLKSGDAGHLFGFWEMKLAGDPARLKTKESDLIGKMTALSRLTAAENDIGQWNRVEILADAGKIKVWLNDQLVNESTDAEILSGPLALQSEGGEVHFRKVTVTPLAP